AEPQNLDHDSSSTPNHEHRKPPSADGSELPLPTEKRLDLLAAGFTPIPARGKATLLEGGTQKTVTVDEVATWWNVLPHRLSHGMSTSTAPTFDVDVLNAEAADAVEALVRERVGGRGKFLVRTGQPPKRAIPFKTSAPFKKITVTFAKRDGTV